MEFDEIAGRINNSHRLEQLEDKPAAPYDPAELMETLTEAKDYIRFLYAQLQEMKKDKEGMYELVSDLKDMLRKAEQERDRSSRKIDRLLAEIRRFMDKQSESQKEIDRQEKIIRELSERIKVLTAEKFDKTSQKKKRNQQDGDGPDCGKPENPRPDVWK